MIKMLTFTVSVFVVYSVWYIHDTREQTIPVAESAGKIAEAPAVSGLEQPVAPRVGRWVSVVMNVSAYCACEKCCGTGSPGITASGAPVDAVSHLVAAPPEYPFGTVMIVPGYGSGPVCVLDRGGAIKGNRLDVLVYDPKLSDKQNHKAARKWGRRQLTVKIWEQN